MWYSYIEEAGKFIPATTDPATGKDTPIMLAEDLTAHPCPTREAAYNYINRIMDRAEINHTEIPFGGEHSACALAFVGEKYWKNNSFDNDVYLTPVLYHYDLSGGRVLEVVEKIFSKIFTIFPSWDSYMESRRARRENEIDPETGRRFSSYGR